MAAKRTYSERADLPESRASQVPVDESVDEPVDESVQVPVAELTLHMLHGDVLYTRRLFNYEVHLELLRLQRHILLHWMWAEPASGIFFS